MICPDADKQIALDLGARLDFDAHVIARDFTS